MSKKSTVTLSFDVLPEAKLWQIGRSYRVEMKIRQLSMDANGATFEVLDTMSLSHKDKLRHGFITGNKYTE